MVPYFDRPDLLRLTVGSVLTQHDPGWRLTVVDDGPGAAGVEEFLAGLADPRVRYLHNRRNLGINRNFQRCLDLAELPLVVITGADDILLPNYVRTVRAAHDRFPQVSVVQPGVEVIDGAGALSEGLADRAKRQLFAPRTHGATVLSGEGLAASLLRGNWLYFPSLAWRRDRVKRVGFREHLHVVQDLALVLDLVRDRQELLVDPTICFQYRRHRSSVSSWRAMDGSRFAEERAFFRAEQERLAELGWPRAARAARRHVSSRINAMTLLPAAIGLRRPRLVKALARHAVAR